MSLVSLFTPFVILIFLISSCATAPISGRTQWNMVNRVRLVQNVQTAMDGFIHEVPFSKKLKEQERISRIGCQIAQAAEEYLSYRGHSDLVKGFAWEFILVEDSTVNAFCMPGGKIFVFEGILPYCQDDGRMAALLGHEIAHAIAHHGAESLSKVAVAALGSLAVAVATADQDTELQEASLELQQGLSEVFGFANSRIQEKEADQIGLLLMARAGYNPLCAVEFWEKLIEESSEEKFDLYNTHPTHQKRVQELYKHMDIAYRHYEIIKPTIRY